MHRSQTKSKNGLTVTVGVPDRQQTKQIFGTSLYDSRIQPVWIRVHNASEQSYDLIKTSADHQYFSPLETSWKRHLIGSPEKNLRMDHFFYAMDFPNPIPAGETKEGYIFTNLNEGYKDIPLDFYSNHDLLNMHFVIPVPGLVTDLSKRDLTEIYEAYTDIQDLQALRAYIESLPATTTNQKGTKEGDPVNFVLIGNPSDILAALIRQHWHVTEVTYGASAWKTIKSYLFGSRYHYSPISPLYVFGRSQDLGLQKARHSIVSRNHMRLWLLPQTYQGQSIWAGQISRDIGVTFSKRRVFTHAIDPDLDETRQGLVEDMAYSQSVSAIAYAGGSRVSTFEQPQHNLESDYYLTDGLRAVLFFNGQTNAMNAIKLIEWEQPIRRQQRIDAGRAFQSSEDSDANQTTE